MPILPFLCVSENPEWSRYSVRRRLRQKHWLLCIVDSRYHSRCHTMKVRLWLRFSTFNARQRSVCLSTGEMSAPLHAGIHPPGTRGRHPPGRYPQADTPQADTAQPSACWDTPPCPVHTVIHTPPLCSACWDTANKQAVHIPLECILVS